MYSLNNNQAPPEQSRIFYFKVIRNINGSFKDYCVSKTVAGGGILFD